MPDATPNLMTVFAEALERTDPVARVPTSTLPVRATSRSASGSRRCSSPTTGPAGSWSQTPAPCPKPPHPEPG